MFYNFIQQTKDLIFNSGILTTEILEVLPGSWSISRLTDLSQRKFGDILKTQSSIIKILTFFKCSKILNIFKSLKISLTLGEKKYSLRNGAPLKERNKIKFHRSFRGEGGCSQCSNVATLPDNMTM